MNEATSPEGEIAPEAEEINAEAVEVEEAEADFDADAPEDGKEGDETESESEDDGEGDDEEDDAEIELNLGGQKLRVPKGAIREDVVEKITDFAHNLEVSYTRKFQDIGEQRKALEAQESAVKKLQSLNGEALDLYSKGLSLRSELEQLSTVDVNALWQSDPDQARRVSDAISRKQAEFQQIVSRVNATEETMTREQEAELARLREEGKVVVEKRVPGFTRQVEEVVAYMVDNYGLDKETAANDWPLNPAFAEVAYKAMLFDRMKKAQTKTKAPPRTARPVTPMKAKGTAGKAAIDLNRDADKISADEWMKRRNAELQRARG